jgi:cytidylate kinase
MREAIVIAVDGTAASGKGTIARKLAQHFGFAHLDSGSLYRLVALGVLDAKKDPSREADALSVAQGIDPDKTSDPRLRSDDVGRTASLVSVFGSVRAELLAYQRRFAASPPRGLAGAVIDGRDIGTVICPTAPAKLFVDAKAEVRARRRWEELRVLQGPAAPDRDAVLADIVARDKRDRERKVAPLKLAIDADLLDTTDLDIDAAFAAALALVEPKVEAALKAKPRG